MQWYFLARYSLEKCSKKLQLFCTVPQIVPNCRTIILRKCSDWSCFYVHGSHSRTQLYCLFFFGLQTEGIKYFFLSNAVFLGFYNVSISCQFTVKTCQIISDYWLFTRMNWKHRLSTTAYYYSLYTKWVIVVGFIEFGCWQITWNATKSESVGLKRTKVEISHYVFDFFLFLWIDCLVAFISKLAAYSSAWSTSVFGRPDFHSIGCCSL